MGKDSNVIAYVEYLKTSVEGKQKQLNHLKDQFKNYVNLNIDNASPTCFVQNAINDLLNIQELQDQVFHMKELLSFYDMGANENIDS